MVILDFISICGYHHDNYPYTGGGWESSLICNVRSYAWPHISDHEIGLTILYSFSMLQIHVA